MVARDEGVNEGVVAGQRLPHALGLLLPQTGAAHHVCEDEGDRSLGDVGHVVSDEAMLSQVPAAGRRRQ